jgi:hypothetical protein
MALKVILKADGTEVILPVTPESIQTAIEWNIEKVNIHALGDVAYYGERAMRTISLPFLIPSNERAYAFSGGYVGNTYGFIEVLSGWMKDKKKVRYIVGDTSINDLVLIETIEYGEDDGTRDLTGTITLQQTQEVSTDTGSARSEEETTTTTAEDQSYTIQKGDTLWNIAQQYYGDATLCWQLAEYNDISNANLIQAGATIKIPDASALSNLTYSGSKESVSVAKINKAATAADVEKATTPLPGVGAGAGGGNSGKNLSVWVGTLT